MSACGRLESGFPEKLDHVLGCKIQGGKIPVHFAIAWKVVSNEASLLVSFEAVQSVSWSHRSLNLLLQPQSEVY